MFAPRSGGAGGGGCSRRAAEGLGEGDVILSLRRISQTVDALPGEILRLRSQARCAQDDMLKESSSSSELRPSVLSPGRTATAPSPAAS